MYASPKGAPSRRALTNDDILREIFDGYCYRNQGELTAVDLKNSALVCRAFSEPALRVLWKTMSPPTPLWSLVSREALPAVIFFGGHIAEIVSSEFQQFPERWERFQWYARFVRELEISERNWESAAYADFFRAVLKQNGGNPVLPSLQVLSISPKSFLGSSFSAFPTATLQAVTLKCGNMFRVGRGGSRIPLSVEAPFQDPIHRLRKSLPYLQRLHLPGASITAQELSVITSFEYLREVSIGAVSTTTFRSLVAMPCLSSLEIDSLQPDEHVPCGPISAHTLRTLSIGRHCSLLTELFETLRLPNLRTATLRLVKANSDTALDYIACLATFARAVDPAVFEAFTFHSAEYRRRLLNNHTLVELLTPLFQLRELKHFALRGTDVLPGDDKDYMDMVSAWPKLEVFSFLPTWQNLKEGAQVPTPVILDHFHTCCPNLRMLHLPYLDLHSQEFMDVPPPPDGERHGLARLIVGYVGRLVPRVRMPDEQHIEDVARYVLRLFPSLDFALSNEGPKPDWETWGAVFGRYRVLREA